jgi:hypothetical protein
MEQSLNDQILEITSIYGASTAAGMIRDIVAQKFDDLLEELRSTDWRYDGTWTEEMDNTMTNWISENI